MKKLVVFLAQILFVLPMLAQDDGSPNPIKVTRQGFGSHDGIDISLGFINAKLRTEGSAYYFDNWNTEGVIYIIDKGRVKIKKVNINLFDSKLEAIYDENSVFTFNSDNLIKIVINDKVFRTFEINKELKIFEQIYNDGFSVYRYYSVIYSQGSKNPMLNRKTNKYINKAKYYLYRDGELTMMKLSKKSFSKLFQSDEVSQESIFEYIKKSKLSLNKEDELIKILKFVNK